MPPSSIRKKRLVKALSPKRALFIENILKGMPAAEAYREAGYSPAGARQSAARLLAKDEIQEELARRRYKMVHAGTLPTAEDIIHGLATEARGEGPDSTASSRISAWRALADIHGLLGGSSPELPEGLQMMLEALARGTDDRRRSSVP